MAVTLVDDTARASTVCTLCERAVGSSTRSCEAYPKRGSIPDEIWFGKNKHLKPFPGDGGKQFVLLDETRPEDSEQQT